MIGTTVPYTAIVPFLERLGLEPNLVREVTMTPSKVTVTLYALDAAGEKYCSPVSGGIATEILEFAVEYESTYESPMLRSV